MLVLDHIAGRGIDRIGIRLIYIQESEPAKPARESAGVRDENNATPRRAT